jgi:hypothetical protein
MKKMLENTYYFSSKVKHFLFQDILKHLFSGEKVLNKRREREVNNQYRHKCWKVAPGIKLIK